MSMEKPGVENVHVLAIECLKGSSKADEWNWEMLQTGDIVEELRIGSSACARSPFKSGRSGVQKLLHTAFKRNETSITVRVRRGRDEFVELQACIVPNDAAGRKQYMLRSIDDPNYAVGFVDRTESECFDLQGTRSTRVVTALCTAQLKDGYVSYAWEKMMRDYLPVPNSSCFLSLLVLPSAPDRVSAHYNDLDDTLARANAWLVAAQASGVPVVFMNVQTEPLLTKISGERASSTVNAGSMSELSIVANAGLYGFEDYHGVDIGVVRSVRLWYAPVAGELPVELELKDADARLGFAISRTEEGFIYISSVMDVDGDHQSASQRAGLNSLYRAASEASKLLVVSRVANEKVLPWMVSSSGAIRCYDTVSLSQKLSLHRHALKPILIHVFLWDRNCTRNAAIAHAKRQPPPSVPASPAPASSPTAAVTPQPAFSPDLRPSSTHSDEQRGMKISRDTAGEFSFRLEDLSLAGNNWV
ncbi:unnamed protein product [Victoria cruziana]